MKENYVENRDRKEKSTEVKKINKKKNKQNIYSLTHIYTRHSKRTQTDKTLYRY